MVYRPDSFWVERFDIRQDSSGRLNMSEAAALRFARGRKGDRAVDRSPRAEALFRECPHCAEEIRVRAKICKHCGRDVAPPDDE